MRSTSSGYRRVLAALNERGVEYVVCGGIACILHGVSRVTNDLDLAVNLSDSNLARLVEAARALELQLRMPEPLTAILDADRRAAWVREKGAVVFTLVASDSPLQIDVFLEYPITFTELALAADRMKLDGEPIRVSSREHLIEAKRLVTPQREIDRRDIEDLERLRDTAG